MIADLKPYSAYVDLGQDWLGSVPAHWSVLRAKCLFREVDERSTTGKEELLSVSHLTGVTPRRLKTVTMFLAKSNVGHKVCQPGDMVINTLWAWMGALGAARHAGIVSPAYGVYRPIEGGGILPAYADHLLRTPLYAAEYQRRSTGVNSSRLRLYPEQFLRMPVLVPPIAEQAAIVRLLEWANGRLSRAIRAKRKVIALLMEQRRAVIHRAVTQGLNPAAPLKVTNTPWLGDIPRHWELVALGRVATSRCDGPFGSGLKSMHYTDVGVRVIRLQNIGSGDYRDRNGAFISTQHYSTLGDHDVGEGDLLVAGLGDERMPAGRACVAPKGLGPAMVKADCFRFRLRAKRTVGKFLATHLSATAAAATACLSTGATRLRINLQAAAARSVALPPLEEQQSIVDFIEIESSPLDSAVARLEREIDLLSEYRTRLIADVVTGKLDAREAAARLPAVSMLDVADDLIDDTDEPELADEEATA